MCHHQAQHVRDIFLISDFTYPDTGNQDKQSHKGGYQLSNSIYDMTGYSVLITEMHIYIPRCLSVWLVKTGPASIGTLVLFRSHQSEFKVQPFITPDCQ